MSFANQIYAHCCKPTNSYPKLLFPIKKGDIGNLTIHHYCLFGDIWLQQGWVLKFVRKGFKESIYIYQKNEAVVHFSKPHSPLANCFLILTRFVLIYFSFIWNLTKISVILHYFRASCNTRRLIILQKGTHSLSFEKESKKNDFISFEEANN